MALARAALAGAARDNLSRAALTLRTNFWGGVTLASHPQGWGGGVTLAGGHFSTRSLPPFQHTPLPLAPPPVPILSPHPPHFLSLSGHLGWVGTSPQLPTKSYSGLTLPSPTITCSHSHPPTLPLTFPPPAPTCYTHPSRLTSSAQVSPPPQGKLSLIHSHLPTHLDLHTSAHTNTTGFQTPNSSHALPTHRPYGCQQ